MRKQASLVINPRTGQNLAKITDVLAILSAAGWKTELAIKEYGGHSMELAQAFSSGPDNLVVAYGGDGTLNQVVNGVMESGKAHRSSIGVIPGGTANVWAGEVGIPTEPVLAALSLVNSSERKVDVGRVTIEGLDFPSDVTVDDEKKSKKKQKAAREKSLTRHHFLLMAGLGIDAAIMGNVSKPLKYRIGPLAVGLSAAKELPSQHAFPIEISSSGAAGEEDVLWKGEAIQVVIGNTRRYADIAEMTPDAYIDDGILDVCVITGGDPLSTLQQITSLLLRRKPDNLTAEYFHGAHLKIRVPASVPMQLDGSTVKLKDYLSKAEYGTLQGSGIEEKTQITYCFDALPKALTIEIPRTYDDELFEHNPGHEEPEHVSSAKVNLHTHRHHHRKAEEEEETPSQQRTEEAEGSTKEQETQATHAEASAQEKQSPTPQDHELIEKLVQSGRKVTVVGKVSDPARKETYIIAGGSTKESTGEVKPVAVVVNAETAIFSREGERLLLSSVQEMHEGMLIIVEGKKSKRGVIQAARMIV